MILNYHLRTEPEDGKFSNLLSNFLRFAQIYDKITSFTHRSKNAMNAPSRYSLETIIEDPYLCEIRITKVELTTKKLHK